MDLRPLERTSASDEVFDRLASSIVDGEVAVGEPIPSERALSDALGVSRPVVREALKRLAHAGLVEIRHGGATTVTDYRQTGGLDLLGVLVVDRSGHLDLEVARGILEARADLGPAAIASAARRATPDDVADLRDVAERLRGTDDHEQRLHLALEFWDVAVDATHNVVHRLLFNALRRAYEPVLESLAVVMQVETADPGAYAAIVDAIAARDPDRTEQAVRSLVQKGSHTLVAVIDELLATPDPDQQ